MAADKPTVIVFWDNPNKTTLIYDFAAAWNWTDFFTAKTKGDGMIDSVPHEVAVIFSGPTNVRLPENFLSNIVNINRSRHPRATVAIIVMPNAFVRAMFNTVTRLYSGEFKKVSFVNSLDEARIVVAKEKTS